MITWNLAGLKKKLEDTWNYIRSFDIIGLTETWLEEKEENWIQRKLKGYVITNIPAVRQRRRGRAKGGMIIAIREGIEVLEQEIKTDIEEKKELVAIKVKIEGKAVIPILTYTREHRTDNWIGIEKIVEDNVGEIILLRGDFNARTTEEGG